MNVAFVWIRLPTTRESRFCPVPTVCTPISWERCHVHRYPSPALPHQDCLRAWDNGRGFFFCTCFVSVFPPALVLSQGFMPRALIRGSMGMMLAPSVASPSVITRLKVPVALPHGCRIPLIQLFRVSADSFCKIHVGMKIFVFCLHRLQRCKTTIIGRRWFRPPCAASGASTTHRLTVVNVLCLLLVRCMFRRLFGAVSVCSSVHGVQFASSSASGDNATSNAASHIGFGADTRDGAPCHYSVDASV
jgi:hypothetical protein